jgi:hypothetical protein
MISGLEDGSVFFFVFFPSKVEGNGQINGDTYMEIKKKQMFIIM